MIINHLLARRSVVANKLSEPGPDGDQLVSILTAAARVPDHKKLAPWRFILFQEEARKQFGNVLVEALKNEEGDPSEARLEMEANRFMRAPVIVAVVTSFVENPVVPEWEQILSTGAVCQNMLLAATSLGFSAQWITEWYAYSNFVQEAMGIEENERIAGFIYIGTAQEKPNERDRPNLEDIVTEWQG